MTWAPGSSTRLVGRIAAVLCAWFAVGDAVWCNGVRVGAPGMSGSGPQSVGGNGPQCVSVPDVFVIWFGASRRVVECSPGVYWLRGIVQWLVQITVWRGVGVANGSTDEANGLGGQIKWIGFNATCSPS